MSDAPWLKEGGWRRIDENVPVSVILETVQHTFDHIPSSPNLLSFQGGRWPHGNWHWEPEGHLCSSEPTHWRPMKGAAAEFSLAMGQDADSQGEPIGMSEAPDAAPPDQQGEAERHQVQPAFAVSARPASARPQSSS